MTNLRFFGGVSTIGGNCIILEDNDARIMLDNGMCFSKEGEYYKDFLSARMGNDLRDFLALDLVPKIGGIYGKEKINDECADEIDSRGHYMLDSDLESYESYKERTGKPFLDAILLTHVHLDHIRNLIFMPAKIPVVCSQVTRDFLEIISDLTNHNFLHYSYSKKKKYGETSYFPNSIGKKNVYEERTFLIAEPGKTINISCYEITGYPVDHSVPGSMAFKVKTPDDKIVLYTGDIRFHGHEFERKASDDFVKEVSSIPIDILITEGTRIDKKRGVSENGVFNKVLKTLNEDNALNEKMIFTSFPWKSISRFLTVFKIAQEIGRTLVIHPKLAYVLHHFKDNDSLGIKNILNNEEIKIYKPRKKSMLYSNADYSNAKEILSFNIKWKRGLDVTPLLYSTEYGEDIYTKAYEIHDSPNKYILHLEFYGLNQLIDIQPPKNSYYFNLKTEPFDEEGFIEQKVLEMWMKKYDLELIPSIHASGHASGKEIFDMINKINPKKIFPVHTEHPELFTMNNSENNIILGKEYPL